MSLLQKVAEEGKHLLQKMKKGKLVDYSIYRMRVY